MSKTDVCALRYWLSQLLIMHAALARVHVPPTASAACLWLAPVQVDYGALLSAIKGACTDMRLQAVESFLAKVSGNVACQVCKTSCFDTLQSWMTGQPDVLLHT